MVMHAQQTRLEGYTRCSLTWRNIHGNVCHESRNFYDAQIAERYILTMKLDGLKSRFLKFLERVDWLLKEDTKYRATELKLEKYNELKELASWITQVPDLATLCSVILVHRNEMDYLLPRFHHPKAGLLATDVSDILNFCAQELKTIKENDRSIPKTPVFTKLESEA